MRSLCPKHLSQRHATNRRPQTPSAHHAMVGESTPSTPSQPRITWRGAAIGALTRQTCQGRRTKGGSWRPWQKYASQGRTPASASASPGLPHPATGPEATRNSNNHGQHCDSPLRGDQPASQPHRQTSTYDASQVGPGPTREGGLEVRQG